MKRTTKQIYRVLGTDHGRNFCCSDQILHEVKYNNKKPLYTSNSIDDAVRMFQQLAAENYRENLLLIADFGMLTGTAYMKQALCHFNGDQSYDELMPFLAIAEYHDTDDFGDGITWIDNEIHIAFKGTEHLFLDAVDALHYLEERMFLTDNVSVKTYDYNPVGHVKIRTLVNSKDFRKNPEYKPCGKIEVDTSTFVTEVKFA